MENTKYVAYCENDGNPWWLAGWEGDPGRSKYVDNAKAFDSKRACKRAISKAIKENKFRNLRGKLKVLPLKVTSSTMWSGIRGDPVTDINSFSERILNQVTPVKPEVYILPKKLIYHLTKKVYKCRMFKMPFFTKHFNKNQKVWIVYLSGAMSAEVVGKYRGKGRYIKAWVSWDRKNRECPNVKEVTITKMFSKKIAEVSI